METNEMNQRTVQVLHILNIESDDYKNLPGYRDYVKEFIKWDSLKGPVAVSVDGGKSVVVTTIEQVDQLVGLPKKPTA